MRACGPVEAVTGAALAPFAHGLGADAVALGDGAAGFGGARDLGTDSRGGSGVRVDVQHGPPLSWCGGQVREPVSIPQNSQPNRVPTMFRDLTTKLLPQNWPTWRCVG